jgi:hypothetical protein
LADFFRSRIERSDIDLFHRHHRVHRTLSQGAARY